MGPREVFVESMDIIGVENIQEPCVIFDTLYEIQKLIAMENSVDTLLSFCSKFEQCEWYEACSIIKDRVEQLKLEQNAILQND